MNLDGSPDEEDREFFDLYGPWDSLDPADLQALMAGFDEPWWIVGGHAIDAFTGTRRPHEDVDLATTAAGDPEHVADHDEVTWVDARGLRFLNPEIVLLFKAAHVRPKDELGHPWNDRLSDG